MSESPSTQNGEPSRWKLLREHVLVVPPPPTTSNESESNSPSSEHSASPSISTIHSGVSPIKQNNAQVNPFRGVLRFKTTVQQRTDVSKMEKDIEKLLTRRYGGGYNMSGNPGSVGIVGQLPVTEFKTKGHKAHKSSSSAQDGMNGSVIEPLNHLGELHELLKRGKNLVRLPSSQVVLAELAKPFFNYPVNVDDCKQALSIFDFIRATYQPSDSDENFARIQWCCKLLETHHSVIRKLVCDVAEDLLNKTAMESYFPTSIAAIHALVYTFVHTLVVTSPTTGLERTEETIRLHEIVTGFLARLAAGTLVSIDPDEMLIGDARVQIHKYDSLARCVFLEGLVKCLFVKDLQLRKYIMSNLIGKYWVTPDQTMQTLYEHVIQLFAQAAFEILADPKSCFVDQSNVSDSLPYYILKTLHCNLPAKNFGTMPSPVILSLISVLVSIFALNLDENTLPRSSSLPSNSTDQNPANPRGENGSDVENNHMIEVINLAKLYLETLWKEGRKAEIIQLTKEALGQDSIKRCISIYNTLVFGLNEDIGSDIVKETINDFFAKIVNTRPDPSPNLKRLLLSLASTHRPQFFKPMLACISSDSESKVSEHLHLVATLQSYLNGVELFMQDVELITFIILGDVGTLKTGTKSTNATTVWGSTTLGQCVLIMEFVWVVRHLRLQRATERAKDTKIDEIAKKFLDDLERRLAMLIAAKEKSKMIPMPIRVLLSDLFLEIRLYCKAIARPGWLARVIDWLINSAPGTVIYRDSLTGDVDFSTEQNSFSALRVNEDQLDEVEMIFQRIRVVYATLDDWTSTDGDRDDVLDVPVPVMAKIIPVSSTQKTPMTPYNEMKRRSAVVPSLLLSLNDQPMPSSRLSKQKLHRFNNFTEDTAEAVLSLLVAVFPTLATDEYIRLGPHIWDRFLNDREHKAFTSASFLFIQCGEKAPAVVESLINRDLYSTNALIRAMTLRKISSLFGHRHQLLSHPYISSSSRRRLFRTQPPPIPFVPTDLGSSDLIVYDSTRGSKMKSAASLNADIRRRIQELGWEEQDEIEQERIKRTTTPISLLPTFYLDDENLKVSDESSANQNTMSFSIQPTFNRRRAVAIPILSVFSLRLVDLLDDAHGGVYNTTKEIVMYFIRDDPVLFLRIYFSNLGKEDFQVQREMLTRLRLLISMQHIFPPGFTYTLFNHIAGILKWYSRDNKANGLLLMTNIMPLLAELVLAINDMAVRDFRKNKIENILCNNGHFWFTEGTPASMFPRDLVEDHSNFAILDIPSEMFEVAMLRIGHIHFMTNFLLRSPKEVYSLKKMIDSFELMPLPKGIKSTLQVPNEEERYFPNLQKQKGHSLTEFNAPTRREKDVQLLSSLRARAWLNFVQVVLQRLNRNYNDRAELNRFLNGVNIILLENSQDLGIVGQTLVLYMNTTTRFRRLFDTNRGYALFIPALFRVFCESERIQPIRSAITYAWCQFFKVHGESFIFQAVGCLSPLILKGFGKSLALGEWMCSSLYVLFKALNFPSKLPDALGIHDTTEDFQSADTSTLDPAALLNNVNNALGRRAVNLSKAKAFIGTAQEEPKIFLLEDLLRLFLTIIAYDPGSLRGEQMVHILRFMIPHLLQESPSVKSLVDEGMIALIEVFLKFCKTSKPVMPQNSSTGFANVASTTADENNNSSAANILRSSRVTEAATTQAYGKQWQQNDRMAIKRQFLLLVQAYRKHGGTLSDSSHNKIANIIRMMFKDYSTVKMRVPTTFLKEYVMDVLLHNTTFDDGRRPISTFLRHMAPLFRQHYKTMEFSDFIDSIALIVTDKCRFATNDYGIGSVIKEKFLSFGLSIALRPDLEEGERFQPRLCQSLVKLFVAMMVHSDLEMMGEIEKYAPSHQLMAYIIIPICLQFKLEDNLFTPMPPVVPTPSNSNNSTKKATNYWIRLLAYVTKACSRDVISRSKSTAFNFLGTSDTDPDLEEQVPETNRNSKTLASTAQGAATFIISFTALKILLVKGENHITSIPGMWIYIAQFIRKTLAAAGTTHARSGLWSHGSSPPGSSVNLAGTGDLNDTSERANSPYSPTQSRSSIFTSALDFVLWTFLELLVFYKLPLNLYLRTFIHQKLNHAPTGVNNLHYWQSTIDGVPRSPSPISVASRESRRARWRSWGGPPGFQQSQVGKEASSHLDATVSHHGSNVNDSRGDGNRISLSPMIGSPTGPLAPNLVNVTIRSLSNVHTFMGYGYGGINSANNSNNSHLSNMAQELRAWNYSQTIEKLKVERRLVLESYPTVFKLND